MSKGVSLITALVSSLIISTIVSTGVLFVAIPIKILQKDIEDVSNALLVGGEGLTLLKFYLEHDLRY